MAATGSSAQFCELDKLDHNLAAHEPSPLEILQRLSKWKDEDRCEVAVPSELENSRVDVSWLPHAV